MAKHAKLSASSAERWMVCPASVPLSVGYDDPSSEYADEGTAAHFLASECLKEGTLAEEHIGHIVFLRKDPITGEHFESWCLDREGEILNEFVVDDDMARYVGQYLSDVRRVALGLNGVINVEQSLPLTFLTGEKDAEGTSDAVILSPTLVVADLKYGMGVRVEAEDNPQLLIYASAAREQYSMVNEFDDVHVAILQPRLGHISQHTYTHAQLDQFEEKVRGAVIRVAEAERIFSENGDLDTYTEVSEKGCQWCKHKANCSKLADYVAEQIDADFEDLSGVPDEEHYIKLKVAPYDPETLSLKAKSLALIELWMKAVRGEVESLLLKGQAVPGYKLVEGKKGHRKWVDANAAEATMKSMRLKEAQMYDFSLISPTSAEKLLAKESPKRWKRLVELITQTQGAPSVAEASDKRPALVVTPVGDDMEDLSQDDLIGD